MDMTERTSFQPETGGEVFIPSKNLYGSYFSY
jgi:hypothetical protein